MSRSRALLHRSKFDEFLKWATEEAGYLTEHVPGAAMYERARLREKKGSPLIIIHDRNRGDHLTVHGQGVALVIRWLRSTNSSIV